MGFKVIEGLIVLCFLIWLALIMEAEAANLDVKKYGAKADGESDDSQV